MRCREGRHRRRGRSLPNKEAHAPRNSGGETLTIGMMAGSRLIVLSGLFILWRGRKQTAGV